MERLAAEALENGIEAEYARELIRMNRLVPDRARQGMERWPWPLKVYTLGRFALLTDEKPPSSSRKVQHKPLLMLKALVALGGKDVAEGFYQRLMVCHRRLGQAGEALGVYRRCRKTLAAVLGISPSPETEAIARSLR